MKLMQLLLHPFFQKVKELQNDVACLFHHLQKSLFLYMYLMKEYKPTGDQPQAIDKLSKGILDGKKFQTLLGVTGSR